MFAAQRDLTFDVRLDELVRLKKMMDNGQRNSSYILYAP